jgi:hypothetical protein
VNLSEFFRSAAVSLPRGGFDGGLRTFDAFLEDAFRSYIAAVRLVDDHDFPDICSEVERSLEMIERLSERIATAVKHNLEGYPHLAYSEIEKALTLIGIEKLFSTLSGSKHNRAFPSEMEFFSECVLHPPLYRVRAIGSTTAAKQLSRTDIFHVPFESRRRVGNQRYSVAGLPCLYLGSSIWICWQELNRPELDNVWVSRFRLAEDVRVLDLQFPPIFAWHLFGALRKPQGAQGKTQPKELLDRFDERFVTSYILCWPLLAACSIKVESVDGSFFPQYIVPQMLLQWVTKERKVDGIRYFSTKTPAEEADVYAYCNYVFPAREIAAFGHCAHLRKKFHLTAPIPWEFLQIVDIHETYFGPSNAQAVVNLSEDFRVFYSNTEFFRSESKLGVIETREGHSRPVDENKTGDPRDAT